jgi:diguanylate cyclase (GGDEF)-like protein
MPMPLRFHSPLSTPPHALIDDAGHVKRSLWVTVLSACVLAGLCLTAGLVAYAAFSSSQARASLQRVTASTRSAMTLQFLSTDLSGAQRLLILGQVARDPADRQVAHHSYYKLLQTLQISLWNFRVTTIPLTGSQRPDLAAAEQAMQRIQLLGELGRPGSAGTVQVQAAQQRQAEQYQLAAAALGQLSESLSSQSRLSALKAEQLNQRALTAQWTSALLGLLMLGLVTVLLANASRGRSEVIRQLRRLAQTDGLTGVYNRRVWDLTLEQLVQAGATRPATLGVILLDLDHFKRYNDQHGHQAGDDLLREVAQLLQAQLPQGALVARYGGEEFGLLLPDLPLPGMLDLLTALQSRMPAEQTFSAGLSLLTPGEDSGSVVARADRALYRAKHSGRACTVTDDWTPARPNPAPAEAPLPGSVRWRRV